MISGTNVRTFVRFTDKPVHDEASTRTHIFDLLRCIQARLLKWVGQILNMCPDCMVDKVLQSIRVHQKHGDLMTGVSAKYS